jgi:steroid delta-isomerase-like uncharacterized protein
MAQTKTDTEVKPDSTAEAKPTRRRITKRKAVEEHARSYFDALARGDLDAMVEHWRDDAIIDDLVPIAVLRGRDEYRSFFAELFAAFPGLELSVARVIAGEREAAVEWRMSGEFTGSPFQGIEPTGKHVELRGLDLLEIEDGRIVSITAYYDGMSFARQVGMMPPPDSGADRAVKSAFNAVTKLRKAVADRTGS